MRVEINFAVVILSSSILALLGSACTADAHPASNIYPTYDPFVRGESGAGSSQAASAAGSDVRRGPTPTYAPVSVTIPTRRPESPLVTPTPDTPKALPTPRQLANEYVVQPGDTLGGIAQSFGVGIESLLEANDLSAEDILALGTTLEIPPPEPGSPGPSYKIIPDSELVLGPASVDFDVDAFVSAQGGYLADYSEEVETRVLSGPEVVALVARNYSVNPRLLLAVLEHRSHWVTESDPLPGSLEFPLGFIHPNRVGLYHQLAWAANELNRGFYLWRANAIGSWVLGDGSIVPIDPSINAGTAGVQNLFAVMDDRSAWERDVTAFGLFQTYFFLFENPFDVALEPQIPLGLSQPSMDLPFEAGTIWAFTGGPHAAWDSGSGWGALDFAPPDVMGCAVSEEWVTAVADGFIIRAEDGAVVQDLDGDGFEQTGWDILYMHVFEQDRIPEGTYAAAGDRIGHPSCEGGISNAAHLHLARKYNGEWIAADAGIPFILSGWTSFGAGVEYDGYLRRGSVSLGANEGASEMNQITR